MTAGPDLDGFLQGSAWSDARREPLTGDASARRYWRLFGKAGTAILAHSPLPKGPDECRRFARIGEWLCHHGYSAPRVLLDGSKGGFLLLEDLGADRFAEVTAQTPGLERQLYLATTDFLIDLHRHQPPQEVPVLDGPALAGLTGLIGEWLLPAIGQGSASAASEIGPIIAETYAVLNDAAPVLSMRDFHAENLMWLPDRAGIARVGLLDFQDAVQTHPMYDLVSLLQDARRDVGKTTRDAVLAQYLGHIGPKQSQFLPMYSLLGAQRALRILGVLARLAVQDGRPGYLRFFPRVQRHLQESLAHRPMADLRRIVSAAFPIDDTDLGERIAKSCNQAL